MSVRDKIVLLSALIIIVGGALIINGRFNAEQASRNTAATASSSTDEQSVVLPRQLSIKDIDTLKDARGAVEAIRQQTLEAVEAANPQKIAANKPDITIETRTIRKEAAEAVRATAQVAQAANTQPLTGSTYTVQKGQTLSDIAIVVFNNKSDAITNAKKIYELNKDILPSMDKIKAGQKLRIPAASNTESEKADTQKSKLRQFADSMQDKVQFMSSKYAPAPKGTLYVVKKGDSLWNISKSSLGSGSRYKEIIEMNKELLEKDKKLSPGMAIVIPN
jgi:nucleoid-associated protein YgaU